MSDPAPEPSAPAADAPAASTAAPAANAGDATTGAGGGGKKKRRKRKKKGGAAEAPPAPAAGTAPSGTAAAADAALASAAAAATAAQSSGGAGGSSGPASTAAGSGPGRLGVSGKLDQKKMVSMLRRDMAAGGSGGDAARDSEAFKFWKTQPVPAIDEDVERHGPIDDAKTVADVRQEPYALPGGFEWSTIDTTDADQLSEVYNLLTNNYVEDDDSMFRFDYSREFLAWALRPPGYKPAWHVGVRQTSNRRLRAFISGIPAETHAYSHKVTMCEINFLCVHKKLRSKRLAPVLIKEVTRRVNLLDIWQAVYTAGVVLPKPVASCRYFHRSLNPEKLIDVEFSRLDTTKHQTIPRLKRLYKLPAEPKIPGIRPMEARDVPEACALLKGYQARFKLWIEFDEAEFAHWMLPRDGVVNSYVVEDPESGAITDVGSFYHLPSTIVRHPRHKVLRAAYSFYNVPGKHTLKELLSDMLICAASLGFDVFNALNLMENGTVLEELKFGPGDGNLQYYLYNWACPGVEPNENGIVLL